MNKTYSDPEIESLKKRVRTYMGERRYFHTLGVAAMAEKLGRIYLPDRVCALRAAGLLHDIAKEKPADKQLALMKKSGVTLDESDLLCPPIFHSFAGKTLILSDFPEFAEEEILSAVASHTVGREGMTVFDEIIFLSDFIEEGRTYPSSIELRKRFFAELKKSATDEERLLALHRACVSAADFTLAHLKATGKPVGKTLIYTKEYLSAKI